MSEVLLLWCLKMPCEFVTVVDQMAQTQAPWMVLSALLVLFIIKLQNDKMSQMLEMMLKLVVLYEQHDERAICIDEKTDFLHDWCIANGKKADE